MRRILKWAGVLALVLLVVTGAGIGFAWWSAELAMARVYTTSDPPLQLPSDPAAIAHGRHLFDTRGCGECHDALGQGRLVADVDLLARLVAPNITPPALLARGYDADRIAAAIRHAVRADGTPLMFMPSGDWSELSDADTAALVAYMATLPASSNEPGSSEARVLGRVLRLVGAFPLLPAERIDHAPRVREAPAAVVSVAFGEYVARTCTGCHGGDFAGGPAHEPGRPPIANLTPAALGEWSEADFLRAMREGRRPDGRELDPSMPWKVVGRMTDTELRATWLYLQQLPAVAARG